MWLMPTPLRGHHALLASAPNDHAYLDYVLDICTEA